MVHVCSNFMDVLIFYCWKIEAQIFLRSVNSWENYTTCLNISWIYNAHYSIKGRELLMELRDCWLLKKCWAVCSLVDITHVTPWEELVLLYFLIVLWSCFFNFTAQKYMPIMTEGQLKISVTNIYTFIWDGGTLEVIA